MAEPNEITNVETAETEPKKRAYTRRSVKKTPCVVLQVKSVPNYQAMYYELLDRQYWDNQLYGTAERANIDENDLKRYEEELSRDASGSQSFLPIAYQKIVGVSMITTDADGKTSFYSYTGDENFVIEKTWAKLCEFLPGKGNSQSYPMIITNDRKKATLPLLISRSAALYKSLQTTLSRMNYGSVQQVATAVNTKDTKIGQLCNSFMAIQQGLGQVLTKTDKWENRRPNYTNPYSNYQPDMSYDFYLPGGDVYGAQLTDAMVGSKSWDTFSYFSISKLLDVYKSYLAGQQIVNNAPCETEIFKLSNKDVREALVHEHKDPRYNPSIPAEVIQYCDKLRLSNKPRKPEPEQTEEETKQPEEPNANTPTQETSEPEHGDIEDDQNPDAHNDDDESPDKPRGDNKYSPEF